MNQTPKHASSDELRQTLREVGAEIGKLLEQAMNLAKDSAGEAKSWAAKTTSRDSAPASDPLDQIERLGELRDKGFITDEEFQAKKADLLAKVA